MNVKNYRIICWQPEGAEIDGAIFVDISPEYGVTHDLLFYSRLSLFRKNHPNGNIVNRAGSIYLSVFEDTNEMDIIFEEGIDIPKNRLVPEIMKTFNKMRAEKKESTLPILSSHQALKVAAEIKKEKQSQRSEYARKHEPQTPQEEKYIEKERELNAMEIRRKIALAERADRDAKQNPIERMKEKMYRYNGD